MIPSLWVHHGISLLEDIIWLYHVMDHHCLWGLSFSTLFLCNVSIRMLSVIFKDRSLFFDVDIEKQHSEYKLNSKKYTNYLVFFECNFFPLSYRNWQRMGLYHTWCFAVAWTFSAILCTFPIFSKYLIDSIIQQHCKVLLSLDS